MWSPTGYATTFNGSMARVLPRALLGIALVSAAYQRVCEHADRRRFAPPGRLVDLGGRNLHFLEQGSGEPAVVIETGSGSLASSWADIAERLSPKCRVIMYDRAGYGWSDPPGWVHAGEHVAHDLRRMLREAGSVGPYVLLGHSLGGLYVRSFAARYPDGVAGMVLVDATHEDLPDRIRQRFGAKGIVLQAVISLMLAALPRGLVRMGVSLGPLKRPARALLGGDTEEEFRLHLALYLTSAFRRASVGETLGMLRTMRELRVARTKVDYPIAVITSAEPRPEDRSFVARFRPDWLDLQANLATLSSDSLHVVAPTGGHFVHRENPELVADVVLQVVEAARTGVLLSRR